jgi:hypothetical protein
LTEKPCKIWAGLAIQQLNQALNRGTAGQFADPIALFTKEFRAAERLIRRFILTACAREYVLLFYDCLADVFNAYILGPSIQSVVSSKHFPDEGGVK